MSRTKCLNKITKPPVWGGQGTCKECRATDNGDDDYPVSVDNRFTVAYKPTDEEQGHAR
jgi:hypothetical protein